MFYRIIGDNLWVLGSFEGSSGDPRGPLGSRGMFRGPKVVEGGPWGSYGVMGDVWDIPWGHRVVSMSLLMIHVAYMPAIQIFLADERVNQR